MATTFTWTIERMDCVPSVDQLSDVVITAYWRCIGEDGAYSSSTYGTCSFTQPGDPFVPYAELTEAEVLGWCWAGGVNQSEQENIIGTEIANQIDPPIVTPPLPW